MKWIPLQIPATNDGRYKDAVRLNSLGSLFLFTRYTLKKTRLRRLHH